MKGNILALFIILSIVLSACSSEEGSSSNCNIKGNVSYNTGEKIYHLPEDQFYDVTKIDESYGEKWFCSEEEAEEAGFRRSLR
jgi:micrococcal nuclease